MNIKMKKFLIGIIVTTFLACNSDDDTQDPVLCTLEARAGLEVTVKDGLGGANITNGVTVEAIDGNYSETLKKVEANNTFVGAYERAGTYIITVTKDGYRDNTLSEPVLVTEDVCHVITESVEVILEKK